MTFLLDAKPDISTELQHFDIPLRAHEMFRILEVQNCGKQEGAVAQLGERGACGAKVVGSE